MTDATAAKRGALDQTARALLIALAAGAGAMVSPPLALLALAALGARALMRADNTRLDFASWAAPILAALTVGGFVGLAGAVGVLFVWRLVADARWSAAEAKRLAAAAGRPGETRLSAMVTAWATPVFGLCVVAYTAPHMVAGLPLDLPHVPVWVPRAAGVFAAGAVFDWALRRAADWRLGELAPAPSAHLLSHHALFLLAFGVTLDVSAGLVAMAAWRLTHAAPGPVLALDKLRAALLR